MDRINPIRLAFFFLMISLDTGNSQSYGWSLGLGNLEYDTESRIVVDEYSNLYTTGFFKGTVDFDPGPGNATLTSGGSGTLRNAYITKFDSTGQFVWVKQLTGDIEQFIRDIAYDLDGNLYVFGYYIGTCDFDPGSGQHNLTTPNFTFDSFILKLDVNGNFVWVAPVGANGNEYAHRITIDKDGNLVAAGIFTGTSDFDPGPNQTVFTVLGMNDVFITKFSADGNFLWAKHIAGNFQCDANGMDTDEDGNIYIAGVFDDRRDFDPGPDSLFLSATGFWDIFTMKLNAAGNLQWVRHLGNDDDNWAHDIIMDDDGYLYVTGHFSGALDFDPGTKSDIHTAILSDVFVWKLDEQGEFIWVVPLGGISYEQGRSISLDRNGSIYVTGFYAETVDFDPGPDEYNLTCTGDNDNNDVFVVKLHPDGKFAWAHTLGGLEDDTGFGLEIGAVDDIFLTGTFIVTAGFNPGSGLADSLVSKGNTDVFYARWRQCLETYGTISPFSCQPYTSPSGHYVWTESGTYLDTIENAAGCDSIITVSLTISDLNLSISQQGNMLVADGASGQFLWLDCDHGFEVVGSGETFTPPQNGNYALVGIGFACSDTSECFAFVMTATEDNDAKNDFTIFPNPAQISFNIALEQAYPDITIAVFDPFGRTIYANHFFDLTSIPITIRLIPGLYFVGVGQPGLAKLKKLIIQ